MADQGIFSKFPRIHEVTAEGVAVWLKGRPDAKLLENKLGNRLLYSLAVSYSAEDLDFDLAVLREAIKLKPEEFLNRNLRQIYIPEEIMEYFPVLQNLAVAFLDALRPQEVTSVVLKSESLGLKNLGCIIKPESSAPSGEILIRVHEKKYPVKIGSLVAIPAEESKVDITFESREAKLLGKEGVALEVTGGKLGILVDARK